MIPTIDKSIFPLNAERSHFLSLLNLDKEIVKARGAKLYTDTGEVYLDFTSQYGAVPFGHNPEFLWKELLKQFELSPGIMIQPFNSGAAVALARKLVEIAPGNLEHVTLACTGAEVVEAAIKMSRAKTGRAGILSTLKGFHGKTMAASLATGNAYYSEVFHPASADFVHIAYDDLDALESALQTEKFAAFLVEPIQGEGGMVVPAPNYLKGCEKLCRQYGTLFVVDEVQVGLGRTGKLFACDDQAEPDILLLAKALGGGLMPISACIAGNKAWTKEFGQRHSSTFANNHLSAAIALKVIQQLQENPEILLNVRQVGDYLSQKLAELVRAYPLAYKSASGCGFMQGLKLSDWDDRLCYLPQAAFESGRAVPFVSSYLLNQHHLFTAPTLNASNVLRIQPNYLTSRSQIDQLLDGLRDVGAIIQDRRYIEFFRNAIGIGPLSAAMKNKRAAAARKCTFPQPSGPKLGTFAFFIHPTKESEIMEGALGGDLFFDPSELAQASQWTHQVVQVTTGALPTYYIPAVPSKQGGYVDGWLIGSNLTPRDMIRLSKEKKRELLDSYVQAAQSKNADRIGLGAFTSVISRSGTWLTDCGVPITTGNAFTALICTESIRIIGRSRHQNLGATNLGIVGAAGSVGRLVTLDLGPECRRVALLGNARNKTDYKKLEGLAGELIGEILKADQQHKNNALYHDFVKKGVTSALLAQIPKNEDQSEFYRQVYQCARQQYERLAGDGTAFPITLSNDIDRELPGCDVVITATSNGEAFIRPDVLKTRAIVCDAARPSDLTSEVTALRPDVTVYEGGLVKLPARLRFGWNNVVGLPTGVTLACLAETIILTMAQANGHYSIGGVSSLQEARQVFQWAQEHGFGPHLPDEVQIRINVDQVATHDCKVDPKSAGCSTCSRCDPQDLGIETTMKEAG